MMAVQREWERRYDILHAQSDFTASAISNLISTSSCWYRDDSFLSSLSFNHLSFQFYKKGGYENGNYSCC